MDLPLPPGAKLLEPSEAIRRIQERDHVLLPGIQRMGYEHERALINLIREGAVAAALMVDGQLGLVAARDDDGTPFNLIEIPAN